MEQKMKPKTGASLSSGPREILRTQRLRLREMTEEDLPALAKIMQDPVAMEAYEKTYSDQQILEWIGRNVRRYRQDGCGLWAAELLESGQVIGQCGLARQTIDGFSFWETGYLFQRAFWGCGYATEAARACRDYAFSQLGASAVYSIVKPSNLASQKVARRCGMTPEREVLYNDLLKDRRHLLFKVEKGEPSL